MCRMFLIAMIILVATVPSRAESLLKTEDIFPIQDKHVHSSSIIECPNGDLLCCWFHGSGERAASDVVVQGARKKRGSAEWGPVFVMADTPEFPDCNPVLFLDRNGRVWLFWVCVLADRWECSQLKYRRADNPDGDRAPTWAWQDVIQLKPGDAFAEVMHARFNELQIESDMWAEYARPYAQLLVEAAQDPYKRQTGWMTRTHPLTLPSGRILLPLYSDGFNASIMAISDDDGRTWRASLPIIGRAPIQPTVVRRRDGSLVAYCRDSGDAPPRVLVAQSTDDGESWSPAVDCDIPNPGSSLEVIVLSDGRWLMVGNDTEQGRHRLTAMLSDDEGKTWKIKRRIEPTDNTGRDDKSFAYPSVLQTRDGLIHVTYSCQTGDGERIRHCVFNAAWLEPGQP